MAEQNNEVIIPTTLDGEPLSVATEIEQIRRDYSNMLVRLSDLEKDLDTARREASEARWSVRLLRNATADLLAPIMLIGTAGFLIGWIEAVSWWDYGLIGGAGIFGLHWLRDVGRNFDKVTKVP